MPSRRAIGDPLLSLFLSAAIFIGIDYAPAYIFGVL